MYLGESGASQWTDFTNSCYVPHISYKIFCPLHHIIPQQHQSRQHPEGLHGISKVSHEVFPSAHQGVTVIATLPVLLLLPRLERHRIWKEEAIACSSDISGSGEGREVSFQWWQDKEREDTPLSSGRDGEQGRERLHPQHQEGQAVPALEEGITMEAQQLCRDARERRGRSQKNMIASKRSVTQEAIKILASVFYCQECVTRIPGLYSLQVSGKELF